MTTQITFPRWALPVSLLVNVFFAGAVVDSSSRPALSRLLVNVFFAGAVVALALPLVFGPPPPPHDRR